MLKEYPYFVPALYLEAAEHHKSQPYAPTMMNSMRLNMGNWILFQEFLHSATNGSVHEAAGEAENPYAEEGVVFGAGAKDASSEIEYEDEELLEDDDLVHFEVEEDEEAELDTDDEEMKDEEDDKLSYDDDEQIQEIIAKATQNLESHGEIIPKLQPEAIKEVKTEEKKTAPVETSTPVEQPLMPAGDTKNEEGLIQPLYSEDYFLHQGIPVSEKIPEETDQMQQPQKAKSLMVVMSFSEWLIHFKTKGEREKEEQEDQKALKTMWQKEKLAAALEEENEEIPENVFEMAVNSITKEEDLASESLAEIMIKQGKHDKAIDMYRKLSLRNPQKSAYFARKIEGLQKERES
jgi:hypothetical protein